MMTHKFAGIFAALLLAVLFAGAAQAQTTRTWISGIGSDANPCSRTAPCRTFAGALGKTLAGGEISVLNPGTYGSVTINKSISIVAEGNEAGTITSVASTTILVNAAATDVVHLRGLVMEGGGAGAYAIRVENAAEVFIENCLIKGFRGSPGTAVEVANTNAGARVFVSNSALVNNTRAIRAVPSGAGTTQVLVDNVTVDSNTNGIAAQANATIRVNNSVVVGNNAAIGFAGGGQVISFGNNLIAGNAGSEVPSSTIALK
jgi:hypothetical protein